MINGFIIAALALPNDKKRELAWKLLDNLGISVLVALDVEDLIEDRSDADLPPVPRELLLQAMRNVAEGDWSDQSTAAKEAVEREIERLTNG
jgi:hypothetical protein